MFKPHPPPPGYGPTATRGYVDEGKMARSAAGDPTADGAGESRGAGLEVFRGDDSFSFFALMERKSVASVRLQ